MKQRRFYKMTEIALMRQLAAEKKSQKYVAEILDRHVGSIAKAALRYNIVFDAAPGRPLGDPERRRRKRAENCRQYRRRKGIAARQFKIKETSINRFDDPRVVVRELSQTFNLLHLRPRTII